MSKSSKRSSKRRSTKCGGSKRRHKRTMKGGSLLSSAALPIAFLGLNTLFGKKSKSRKASRRSRK